MIAAVIHILDGLKYQLSPVPPPLGAGFFHSASMLERQRPFPLKVGGVNLAVVAVSIAVGSPA
jgi:hypothetical protein